MVNQIKKYFPSFFLDGYHFLLALFGAVVYFFPSCQLKVIGVTGTNGKSTVVKMLAAIFEEAGCRVAYSSSINFKIAEKETPNTLRMTMPGRLKIQKFLREAVKQRCQYAILEVTSEGIKQFRQRFISFKTAVLTNLSAEHIEAHGSFAKYRQAKLKLFKAARETHIINLDDENSKYFLELPAKKKIGYTLEGRGGTEIIISGKIADVFGPGLIFLVNGKIFKLNLKGSFNIYNALAAISAALSEGISLEICRTALEKINGLPGRLEEVISRPFKVIVDYAFTPNALEKVYQAVKPKTGRLICVLGACGGGRDKWKRPVLGSLAAKYCDKVIITNEDPYDEDPGKIIEMVAVGAGNKAEKISDRRKAINFALKSGQENDVVIITGKGCEPSICLAGGKKIPWDDRQVVREEFKKL